MEFQGFSPETFDFLWGIRLNNNRDWFLEHKPEYRKYLYEPMKAMGRDLYEPFRDIPNMVCKVSRIYRDMRMPQPNGPYKESLWISLRQDAEWWGEHPCLYFEIRPEAANYGFVNWHPKTQLLEKYRRDLIRNPQRFAGMIHQVEEATGMVFEGEEFKRKKPVENPALERFMNRKNFFFERSIAPGDELFTSELAERVQKDLVALLPVYRYFMDLEAEGE